MISAGKQKSGLLRAGRERPGPLLVAFLVLYALSGPAAFTFTHNSGLGGRPAVLISIPRLILVPFLTWRVWRGGRISRVLLILNGVLGYAGIALHLARLWRPLDLWLLADLAAQIALLASPAVYQRTRPGTPVRAATAAPLAGKPRGWMLLCGLLAGLVITLLFLGQMGWTAVPLVKDWAQWSLVSGSVLYAFHVLRLGRQDRPEPAPGPHSPRLSTAKGGDEAVRIDQAHDQFAESSAPGGVVQRAWR